MKKIVYLITTGLIFSFFVGCEKEPIVTVYDPFINVTVSPETVEYGGASTLKWNSTHADTITLNGVQVMLSGQILFTELVKDTTFNFIASSSISKKTISKSISITVLPVTPPPVKMLQLNVTPDTGFITKIYPDGTDNPFAEVPIGGYTNIYVTAINADSVNTDCPNYPPEGNDWGRPNDSTLSGGFNTPLLSRDTVYHFWAYGNGQVAMDSIVIKVPVYNLTEIETVLVGKKRYLARSWFKVYEGDNWQEMSLNEDAKGRAYLFFPNHWAQSYSTTNGQEEFYGRGEWSIYANDTMISGLNYAPCHIEELNDSILRYWTKIVCFDCEVDSVFQLDEYKVR